LDEACGRHRNAHLGETHAVVIVQGGKLSFEHYGDGYTPDQTHLLVDASRSPRLVGSWSADGKLDIYAPATCRSADARRSPRAITRTCCCDVQRLKFIEDYVHGGTPRSACWRCSIFGSRHGHYAAMQRSTIGRQSLAYASGTPTSCLAAFSRRWGRP